MKSAASLKNVHQRDEDYQDQGNGRPGDDGALDTQFLGSVEAPLDFHISTSLSGDCGVG